MSGLEIIAICVSTVVGALGCATIFAGAWVKASRIDKMQEEIDKLWDKFSTVTVLEAKIEAIEDGIREIKQLLKR
jgi:steroid 5-alpha reductase family enzyme